MSRFLGIAGFGALLGASVVYVLLASSNRPADPSSVDRDILVTSNLSRADAEHLREQNYATLDSVADIMALPTAFSRTEALYALAGRSDAGRLQALLFDSLRIADDAERSAALDVLFFRLVDLDPKTALALSRLDAFAGPERVESLVWRRWSLADLDAALQAARKLNERARRNVAAQAMFSAYGHAGTPEAGRIAAALGMRPDSRNQYEFVIKMIERSLDETMAYLNGLPPGLESQQMLATMANYFASHRADEVAAVANMIDNSAHRQMFDRMLDVWRARQEPEQTLRSLLSSSTLGDESAIYRAAQELAAQDLSLALQFFDEASSPRMRQLIGLAVAQRYAQSDPNAAIEWARAKHNDTRSRTGQNLLGAVLSTIAASDPDRALAELESLPVEMRNDGVRQQVLMQMASTDPERALALLQSYGDSNTAYGRSPRHLIIGTWARRDSKAALGWILANRGSIPPDEMASLSTTLANVDVDAAMQLLPRIEGAAAASLRQSIAQQLVNRGSVDEAQAFISQFEGSPDYPHLQGKIVLGVAASDPVRAEQLARQMQRGKTRDSVLSNLIMQLSMQSPESAMRVASSIDGASERRQATSTAVQLWAQRDSGAASNWVLSRPPGRERDGAIVSLLGAAGAPIDADRLMRSVSDPEQRLVAESAYIPSLARRDPGAARARLARSALPDDRRAFVEEVIRQREQARPGVLSNSPSR